jgi:hypothetical protein
MLLVVYIGFEYFMRGRVQEYLVRDRLRVHVPPLLENWISP